MLIDQRGRPIYYAIHMNSAMAEFFERNHLTTVDGIQTGVKKASLKFDDKAGLVEYKSAWMVIDSETAAPGYFTAKADIPQYTVSNGKFIPKLDQLGHPITKENWVAMLALHVVFTLPNHPELIWSTFEHVSFDGNGKAIRDNAPAAHANPSATPVMIDEKMSSYPLFKKGTDAEHGNKIAAQDEMLTDFDEALQSFTKNGVLQTSVYRPYPGSKSDGHSANDSSEDQDVITINEKMLGLFAKNSSQDLRRNYQLVGAVWINDPGNKFVIDSPFTNPPTESTDDKDAVLAGEGRLGSTAMESFTESEKESPNCFSCHDTQNVKSSSDQKLLKFSLLNVSHLMSHYIEQQLFR